MDVKERVHKGVCMTGGGVVFDEMTIQPGIQLQPVCSGLEMFGCADFGEWSSWIYSRQKSAGNLQLATYALQVVFWSWIDSDFPPHTCSIKELHLANVQPYFGMLSLLWPHLASMSNLYLCAMMNMFCDNKKYVAKNLADIDTNIACIIDYSHVVKKIRNVIYAFDPSTSDRRNTIHPIGPIGMLTRWTAIIII